MGFRLSLSKVPLDKKDEMWNITDYDQLYEFKEENVKDLVYDFCTDAMLDCLQKVEMPRATSVKLDVESDIEIGVMDKEHFLIFMSEIKKYAYNMLLPTDENKSPAILDKWYWDFIEPSDNPHLLCNGRDWLSAYFDALYLYKTIDWNNEFVYFEIG